LRQRVCCDKSDRARLRRTQRIDGRHAEVVTVADSDAADAESSSQTHRQVDRHRRGPVAISAIRVHNRSRPTSLDHAHQRSPVDLAGGDRVGILHEAKDTVAANAPQVCLNEAVCHCCGVNARKSCSLQNLRREAAKVTGLNARLTDILLLPDREAVPVTSHASRISCRRTPLDGGREPLWRKCLGRHTFEVAVVDDEFGGHTAGDRREVDAFGPVARR
jgi:hypothetical protein